MGVLSSLLGCHGLFDALVQVPALFQPAVDGGIDARFVLVGERQGTSAFFCFLLGGALLGGLHQLGVALHAVADEAEHEVVDAEEDERA